MRSLQGLLFIGLAIFSLKWEFVRPGMFRGEVIANNLPPMPLWMLFTQATIFAVLGFYLIATGEGAYWRKQTERYDTSTFLAAATFFLAAFLNKSAYATRLEDPHGHIPFFSGYLPPFNMEGLALATLLLILLALYYFVRGEILFWRWKPSANTVDVIE
jgi:hypothetical protein